MKSTGHNEIISLWFCGSLDHCGILSSVISLWYGFIYNLDHYDHPMKSVDSIMFYIYSNIYVINFSD